MSSIPTGNNESVKDSDRNNETMCTFEGYSPLLDPNLAGGTFKIGPSTSDSGSEDYVSSEKPSLLPNNYESVAKEALNLLEADYAATLKREAIPREEHMDFASVDLVLMADGEKDVSHQAESTGKTYEMSKSKDLSHVDVDAVARAVTAIKLSNPKLDSAFSLWESSKTEHSIIPATPLSAFLKRTKKSRSASKILSRSATIAEAVCRLGLQSKNVLNIHVVGCDEVECGSTERVQQLFAPVARWIHARTVCCDLTFCLIGPNVPDSVQPEISLCKKTERKKASAHLFNGIYDEWLDSSSRQQPDFAIAFNAGIWGYNEWRTTLQKLSNRKMLHFVVTAYTLAEAEEDFEVIEECLPTARGFWKPELNPYGSRVDRPTGTSPKEALVYRENQAWQAWIF